MADTHEQRLLLDIDKAAQLAFELGLLETAKHLGVARAKCEKESLKNWKRLSNLHPEAAK